MAKFHKTDSHFCLTCFSKVGYRCPVFCTFMWCFWKDELASCNQINTVFLIIKKEQGARIIIRSIAVRFTTFPSYQADRRVTMKDYVHWNPVYS